MQSTQHIAHSKTQRSKLAAATAANAASKLCVNSAHSAQQKRSTTMHNNTYTVVGTSLLNNALKVRFANGLAKRVKVLQRNGHSNIALIECNAMHKLQAAQFALTQTDVFNEEQLACIAAYVKANTVTE
jgi:hypothetical protein